MPKIELWFKDALLERTEAPKFEDAFMAMMEQIHRRVGQSDFISNRQYQFLSTNQLNMVQMELLEVRLPFARVRKMKEEQHVKNDSGKLRYDLIPPSATLALAEILTHGAEKYSANNWRNVEDLDRYVAALMRHLEAYRSGEKLDQDSGKPHLWHVMTNVAFLIELDQDSTC